MIAFPDRRSAVRNPSLDNAMIRAGGLSLCCVVRDITEDGAALKADPKSSLPDQFTLIVPPNKTHSCNVIWRKGAWLGVAFATG
ncbi:PilZ domain-containing protein [Bradyrhizobium macuxiense]|uniref:PilZ domain-containing protein n=1 Tax=Bradyrhizobium macuxiense TaxID=1755647 RepID=UPI0010A95D1B